MSQSLTPNTDVFLSDFAPTPTYQNIGPGDAVSVVLQTLLPGAEFECNLLSLGGVTLEGGDIHVEASYSITGSFHTFDWWFEIRSAVYGTISELSASGTGAPSGGINVTYDWDTLLANYSATSAEFLTSGLSVVYYNLGYFGLIGEGLSVVSGFSDFSLTVPDTANGTDIEITGDGGIEIGNELTPDIQVIGAGGVEIGQDPLVPTPLVVSADVSGMYTLVPGRRFDRVYSRNTDPDQTQDVAIPTPYVKTGYFGA
jgi:hypothetical protein